MAETKGSNMAMQKVLMQDWLWNTAVAAGALLALLPTQAEAKAVQYELTATRGEVNITGEKVDFALMLNGKIPAPTLEFTDGDDAVIVVKNRIPGQELSIHWHGILLPPEMDGVPYVNTPPIHFGGEHVFKFKIRQSGTYWYHSHTGLQEQKGLYGAIVIHSKNKARYEHDVVAVLSDWSNENADSILRKLRKDGDYYLYKKGTMRSMWGALREGGLGNFLYNEWTRMGGMDYSDVGYDAFLINGKQDLQLAGAKKGDRVRVRLINAAASTYFYVSLGQTPLKVISSDGIDISPAVGPDLLIGMAETYDLLYELPENKNYELRITAQDGTGSASAWIGAGEKVSAPVRPFPDMYATMDHDAHGSHSGGPEPSESTAHSGHSSRGGTKGLDKHQSPSGHAKHQKPTGHAAHASPERNAKTITVDELRATESTVRGENAAIRDLTLALDGDMSRYIWFINGKAIHEDRTIEVKEGELVRFRFMNKTMMHHPMHLHGHFFRVLNDNGTHSPLKHTVDVPPNGSRIVEFFADEPGEWMLHCHNLYHLKTGMARVIKYVSYKPSEQIQHLQAHDPHNHDHIYFYGMLEAATNHAQGRFRLSKTWDELEARFETRRDWSWEGEGDLLYRRWVNRYFSIAAGGTGLDGEYRGLIGVSYLLPMLIKADLFIDHKAELRLDLEKRIQWTKYFFTDIDVTLRQRLESEFEVSLMYAPVWAWAGGIKYTGDSVGVGLQFQF
jgi:FtsP/CotA-like multicopper oxidase with cupredoxin domain